MQSAGDVNLPPLQSTTIAPSISGIQSGEAQLAGWSVPAAQGQVNMQLFPGAAKTAMTGANTAANWGTSLVPEISSVAQQFMGTGANMVNQGQQVFGEAAPIFPYAQQVFQTGMDPQNQLYNWLQNQNTQQANAENAMAGVGTTPYGVAETNQANMLFNINWQNQQLQRQIDALTAGSGAIQTGANIQTAGTGIETTGTGIQQTGLQTAESIPAFISGTSAIPFSTKSQISGTNLQDIATGSNISNLPITDLLALLTGQNQSNQVANQTAQLGLNQSALEAQQLAGLVSGAGSLFGGLLGGAGTGLGALGSGLSKGFASPNFLTFGNNP